MTMQMAPARMTPARTIVRAQCLAAMLTLLSTLMLTITSPVASPVSAAERTSSAEQAEARRILDTCELQGGFIIHVGCGRGGLTAALRVDDRFLVHGVDTDPENVRAARERLRSLGIGGPAAVDTFDGKRLPYVDNLANLVVVESLGELDMREVTRVLCPNGIACVNEARPESAPQWTTTVKPRASELDEWTHYLHDADGNAVSHDSVVGPPRHLQWVGSPRWSRHHDRMASMSAAVATGGRIFYIFDEGSRASIQEPSDWWLIARDAFNGTILWKRPIPDWHPHLYPFKSGPAYLPRRLVAIDDVVYVTLGLEAPLVALDAATGKTLRTYQGSRATEDVIASDGVLFIVANPSPRDWAPFRPLVNNVGTEKTRVEKEWPWDGNARHLMAVTADTGGLLWQAEYPVVPLSLAADARNVVFHDGESIVCLDRTDGKRRWRSEPVATRSGIPTKYGPTLVLYQDVVLFSGGDRRQHGLALETGEILWSAEHPPSGHNSPEDLLVVNNLAWSGAIANNRNSGVFAGRNPRTGEVQSEFAPDVDTYWFHHRCYRSKATDKYLLPSRTGIEFVDVRAKHWEIHHWIRGGCLYGVMPANGLIYAAPHDCACYPEAKLYGFNAVAPAHADAEYQKPFADEARLERGPAHDKVDPQWPAIGGRKSVADWPTYRHDAARSGTASTQVPAELEPAWQTRLGGKLTSPVVAEGKLFTASVDTHTLFALDQNSGKTVWTYTTGGRIDSPPTVYRGRVLFGAADGWVYCLRASDGVLAWRFLAAASDMKLTSYEQVESVWPVHGSVLVQDGSLWCVAGRSMFLDGGLRLLQLDPETGRKLSETVLDDRDPETGDNLQVRVKTLNMPVALPDILSSDGKRIYMKSQEFDLEGSRQNIGPHADEPAVQGAQQQGETAHLFAPMGFTDGSWFHRAYWVWGRSFAGGHAGYSQAGHFAPAGRILVHDDANVYGYGRLPEYFRWTTPLEYHLFATSTEIPNPALSNRRGSGGNTGPIQVVVSESLDPTDTPLAVEVWVKPETKSGAILARGGPLHGYVLLIQDGKPRFAIRSDEKLSVVDAKKAVATGTWTHLAGVLTADRKLELYVNGELAASAEAHSLITSDPKQPMEIGNDGGSPVGEYKTPFGLTGMVDEVRIYHGELTAAEIEQHCQDPSRTDAADAKLALHYSFDDGDAKDLSGNQNHGTLTSAVSREGKLAGGMKVAGATSSRLAGTRVRFRWSESSPLLVRAMVLADDILFIAGPPDLVDEEETFANFLDPEIQKKLAEQTAAWQGSQGAMLQAVSTETGKTLAEYRLDAPPVWDAMAAADGRLYLVTIDGVVTCFAGSKTHRKSAGGRQDKLSPVSGRVTLDGTPLEGAVIEFQPCDQGRPRPSFGMTDAEGNYTLRFLPDRDGALPGLYTVRIGTSVSTDSPDELERETLPAKFNAKSELTAEVAPGKNEFYFDLVTD